MKKTAEDVGRLEYFLEYFFVFSWLGLEKDCASG